MTLRQALAVLALALGLISPPLASRTPLPHPKENLPYGIMAALEGGEYRSAVTQVVMYADTDCPITRQPELIERLDALGQPFREYRQHNPFRVLKVDMAIAKANFDYQRTLERTVCPTVDEVSAAAMVEVRERLFTDALGRLQQLTTRWRDDPENTESFSNVATYSEAEAIDGAGYRDQAIQLIDLLNPACKLTEQPALFARLEQLIGEAENHHEALAGTRFEVDLAVARGDREYHDSLIDLNCAEPDQPDVEARITQIERLARSILGRMAYQAGVAEE